MKSQGSVEIDPEVSVYSVLHAVYSQFKWVLCRNYEPVTRVFVLLLILMLVMGAGLML